MTLEEQAENWVHIIDLRGVGYSGRIPYLFLTNRTVFLVDNPFDQWFFKYLKSMQHFIPVKSDLSDLVDKIKLANDNPREVREIRKQGFETAKRIFHIDNFLQEIYNSTIMMR